MTAPSRVTPPRALVKDGDAVPCLTLRPVTERPVTVTSGSNRLVTPAELPSAVPEALVVGPYAGELPPLWDGAAGPRIAHIITTWLTDRN